MELKVKNGHKLIAKLWYLIYLSLNLIFWRRKNLKIFDSELASQ